MEEGELPPHLRPQNHPPPDEDCVDAEKIVVTPVYRGRLQESHERTRHAWRRRSRVMRAYNRFLRDFSAFMDNHAQAIFIGLTYLTGGLMIVVMIMLLFKSFFAKSYP
jgi:hypothetical protein